MDAIADFWIDDLAYSTILLVVGSGVELVRSAWTGGLTKKSLWLLFGVARPIK